MKPRRRFCLQHLGRRVMVSCSPIWSPGWTLRTVPSLETLGPHFRWGPQIHKKGTRKDGFKWRSDRVCSNPTLSLPHWDETPVLTNCGLSSVQTQMLSHCCQREFTFDFTRADQDNAKSIWKLSSSLNARRQSQSKSLTTLHSLSMGLGPQSSSTSKCGDRVMHGQLWWKRHFSWPCLPTSLPGKHHGVLHAVSHQLSQSSPKETKHSYVFSCSSQRGSPPSTWPRCLLQEGIGKDPLPPLSTRPLSWDHMWLTSGTLSGWIHPFFAPTRSLSISKLCLLSKAQGMPCCGLNGPLVFGFPVLSTYQPREPCTQK